MPKLEKISSKDTHYSNIIKRNPDNGFANDTRFAAHFAYACGLNKFG